MLCVMLTEFRKSLWNRRKYLQERVWIEGESLFEEDAALHHQSAAMSWLVRSVNIAKISVYKHDVVFAHARKITAECGWPKLFRHGKILYSQTNFRRDFRQVSIIGFPLNFNSEALSWYSNFTPGFRMKSGKYVKRQSVISFVLIAFCKP